MVTPPLVGRRYDADGDRSQARRKAKWRKLLQSRRHTTTVTTQSELRDRRSRPKISLECRTSAAAW